MAPLFPQAPCGLPLQCTGADYRLAGCYFKCGGGGYRRGPSSDGVGARVLCLGPDVLSVHGGDVPVAIARTVLCPRRLRMLLLMGNKWVEQTPATTTKKMLPLCCLEDGKVNTGLPGGLSDQEDRRVSLHRMETTVVCKS